MCQFCWPPEPFVHLISFYSITVGCFSLDISSSGFCGSVYRSHAAGNQHVCMIAMSANRLLFGRVIIVGFAHLHCNLGLINL